MSDFFISCVFKIILSFIAGFVFGLERKFRQQVVGMRTLILICCSSAMLSILSEWIAIQSGAADTARIAAGVISGIGFLGAGVIMKTGLNVKGLTSAAVIWADSTIGLCIGEGLYIPLLEKIEKRWFPAGRSKSLHLTFNVGKMDMTHLRKVVIETGFVINDVNITQLLETEQTIVHYSVSAPKINDYSKFIDELNKVAPLLEVSITG